MKQNEADQLAQNLGLRFGLPVKAKINTGSNSQDVIIEPDGIHPNEGFSVHIQIGWRSLALQYIPGKFAADLIQQMGNASKEKRLLFSSIAQHLMNERGTLSLTINGVNYDPIKPDLWPENWKSFDFNLRKSPLEINTEDHRLTEQIINTWVERFFGCVIALSPLEEAVGDDESSGLPEGALTRELVNRYERSRYNRTMCINFHGCQCKACSMDFESAYGDIGSGFIHVHHVVPVSSLGENYIINPIDDLVPVCPNCHAMLHRTNPPLSVEQLKQILASHKKDVIHH